MINLPTNLNIRFYDTCSLLLKANSLFDDNEQFILSSITLEELEHIKSSNTYDSNIKYSARKVLHQLDENNGKYKIHIFTEEMLDPIQKKGLTINNDMKILATAIDFSKNSYLKDIIFITNDLSLKTIAKLFFPDNQIESVNEDYGDNYTGYIEIKFANNNEMGEFYSHYRIDNNFVELTGLPVPLINQYLILKDDEDNIIDRLVKTEYGYRNVSFNSFISKHFGKVKPMDVQQQLAADSFTHNKITLIKGPAGSGKTLLALGFLFDQLEKFKIDKIIIFCNTVAAKDAARLGFLPGSRDEKLLDAQIGNLLISKLGSRVEVERLIDEEKLVLLPMSDIRGYDTTGMKAGIYISEAQNLSVSLMKLALQRIGEDSFCIIDGDEKTQVDDIAFAGANNGMRRVSKVFRGHDIYGEVELKEIHRSKIAQIAEGM